MKTPHPGGFSVCPRDKVPRLTTPGAPWQPRQLPILAVTDDGVLAEARDEALLRCALREACQLRVDNERLQHQKAEAEELASRLCAEGFLLRGRLEMLAAATAKAEETASFCVAARLQAAFDNEDNGGTTSERSCRRRAQ